MRPVRRVPVRRVPVRRVTVLAAVLATAACSGAPTPPPVVRVDRGLVATSVSASGTLVSITEQNLGFAEGGELAEVLVSVGDRVQPGQVLARLDDAALTGALDQARAQVDQAQAMLAKIRNSNAVEGAAATLEQSEEVLDATEEQADATDEANDVATERARVQLDFDRESLDRAEDQLADDEAACRAGGGAEAAGAGSGGATTHPKPAAPTTDAGSTGGVGGMLAGAEGDSAATGAAPATPAPTPAPAPAPAPAPVTNPACERVPTDETAVQQAEGAVIGSETALRTAEQRENVDEAGGRLQVENARANIVTAQNNLDLATTDRPADTSAQEAMVRDAQAAAALAQNDLDDAALRAPVAGVVSEVNGAVGEFLGAASGTTSLAPGSSARLPEVADATSTGGGAATGGGAFLVLNDVDSFQLVVPFEESDAARVAPGQNVEVTVDAVPGLTKPATVLAVAPTGEDVSGIVNYYATMVLTEGDPQLRDGQTAEAAVRVEQVDNVLRVPSSVVRTENGQRVVDVPGEDDEATPAPFSPGVVGDEYTEVRSGLRDGQSVLVPQGQVTEIQGGPPPAN